MLRAICITVGLFVVGAAMRESNERPKDPKCCECNDGTIVWSSSGTCSPCTASGLKRKTAPPPGCGIPKTKKKAVCLTDCEASMGSPAPPAPPVTPTEPDDDDDEEEDD